MNGQSGNDGRDDDSERTRPDDATGAGSGTGTEAGTSSAHPPDQNSWDADAYDGSHAFVYEYGGDVLDVLAPEPGEHVLDLGCGTGHLTARTAELGASVVGLDQSVDLLTRTHETYPHLDLVRGDARSLPFDRSFDAVFSNAVLHWLPDAAHDATLDAVHDALASGGRFVAELGGTGNVATIVEAVAAELAARDYAPTDPWYFPSVGEYTPRLEHAGFEVRFARLFDRPTTLDAGEAGLREWLAMFGDGLLSPVAGDGAEYEAVVAAVEDRLRAELFDGESWTADYRRLRFVAVRD